MKGINTVDLTKLGVNKDHHRLFKKSEGLVRSRNRKGCLPANLEKTEARRCLALAGSISQDQVDPHALTAPASAFSSPDEDEAGVHPRSNAGATGRLDASPAAMRAPLTASTVVGLWAPKCGRPSGLVT